MTFAAALGALRRNKMRSILTMLGIIIGVAAVIAMVSVGQGANSAVQRQIESLGTNLLMVMPGAVTAGGVRTGWGGVSTLTLQDADAIKHECAAVAEVTYYRRQSVQVVYGNKNWATSAQGTTPEFPTVRNWNVAEGSFFTARDDATGNRVAVIGHTIVEQLFGKDEDPIGATIRVSEVPFTVIGVLEDKGQSGFGQDQDDVLLMPFNTAVRRVLGTKFVGTVDMIAASAVSAEVLDDAEQQITNLLRERHRIAPKQDDDFQVRNLAEFAKARESASQVMTTLLLSVASISLLVGGIGIMNILLVSVTERTHEIGIRMAIGAKSRHILLQFLVEAITLSMAGGLVGAALGIASAKAISFFADWPTILSPTVVFGSVLFSGAVGIFFGFYPARKASRLDPILALRYE
jgi:ABC-type antimicrobial peptide transport system permease subunit